MIVKVKEGFLLGEFKDGLYQFKGVPYAKAPTAEGRFSAPEPVVPWGGIRVAGQCGPVCPQVSKIMIQGEIESEDCLYLNIITPKIDGEKRPVMVWIHGGVFALGSGSSRLYRGNDFVSKENIVFVTVNYRLGPLGFLYFNDLQGATSGFDDNIGIRDQAAAVQWVIQNIGQFGGDPENITLWGQSAGATSVLTLLTLSELHGKVKGAIAQSPSHHSLWTREEATWNTRRLLGKLGVKEDDLSPLKTMPVYKIIRAAKLLFRKGEPLATRSFVPTYGTSFLPHSIEEFSKKNLFPPLLIGFTNKESFLFTSKRIGLMTLDRLVYEKIINQLDPVSAKRLLDGYGQLQKPEQISDLITDVVWQIPILQLSEQISEKSPLWMYRISWQSQLMRWLGIGAFHGIDLLLHFNMIRNRWLLNFLHGVHLNSSKHLGMQIRRYWSNFAKYQNPAQNDLPEWNVFRDKNHQWILNLDKKITLSKDLYSSKLAIWKTVPPRLILESMQQLEVNKSVTVKSKRNK